MIKEITIIKRDGNSVGFDKFKIKNAILKAMKYGSGIYKEEIADKITNFIQKNNIEEGVWITCNNFDYNALEEKTYPKIDFLDKIAPKNPLVVSNKSGHNGLFNSLAFKNCY